MSKNGAKVLINDIINNKIKFINENLLYVARINNGFKIARDIRGKLKEIESNDNDKYMPNEIFYIFIIYELCFSVISNSFTEDKQTFPITALTNLMDEVIRAPLDISSGRGLLKFVSTNQHSLLNKHKTSLSIDMVITITNGVYYGKEL